MAKVVLITGASKGIGLVIANYLLESGYIVYGTSRNPTNIHNYAFKLIPLEVTDITSVKKAVATIISAEGRIDVLINNAGKGITGAIEETPTDEMRKVFDINFFGVIDMIKEVMPQMRRQKSGLIINTTSIAGYMGLPFRGIYSATKGSVELMSEAASMELKSFGVDVVSIAPGDFATKLLPNRYHTPVYENSVYKEAYKFNLDLINRDIFLGKNPIELALKIHQIIETKKPKMHYKIAGSLEKFSIVLKRILPSRVYEKLLMSHYKM